MKGISKERERKRGRRGREEEREKRERREAARRGGGTLEYGLTPSSAVRTTAPSFSLVASIPMSLKKKNSPQRRIASTSRHAIGSQSQSVSMWPIGRNIGSQFRRESAYVMTQRGARRHGPNQIKSNQIKSKPKSRVPQCPGAAHLGLKDRHRPGGGACVRCRV